MSDTEHPAPDDRRSTVRAAFVRERGFWAPPFEAILQTDPEFLDAYLAFSTVPWRTGTLEPRIRELVYLAADASVTHLHADGTAAHIRSALRHGATPAEVASVLQLVALLGLQSLELGMPLLAAEAGLADAHARSADAPGWLAALEHVDPEGATATRAWTDRIRDGSPLEPRVVELVGVAVNAATTHLNEAATRRHITAALAAGATVAEVAEVLELVAVLGIHTATMAMPILLESAGDAP